MIMVEMLSAAFWAYFNLCAPESASPPPGLGLLSPFSHRLILLFQSQKDKVTPKSSSCPESERMERRGRRGVERVRQPVQKVKSLMYVRIGRFMQNAQRKYKTLYCLGLEI
jgi:hypothetical protein